MTEPDGRGWWQRLARTRWLAPLLLAACALLPYAGTWSYGFVGYDDEYTIVHMPLIRTLGWRTLPDFFAPRLYPHLHEYMPLKNLSYAVDYALFGLSAPGFRIQQQLWWLACVLLLWLWLRELLRALAAADRLRLPAAYAEPLALITALLFSLHPAHVESVTWLSGRKDLLCGAFMLAALYLAFRSARSDRQEPLSAIVLVIVCSALALLSKPMAVVLPALLVLQDYVCARPQRSLRQLLRERALLYAVVSALAVAFAVFYRQLIPDEPPNAELSARLYAGPAFARWGQQLALFAWYSLAPAKLAPLMPPDLLDPAPLSPRALIGYGVLGLLAIGGADALRRRHPLALAIGSFAIPLAPIVLSPAWAQYVAGRYLFHAVVGVLLATTWLGAFLLAKRPERRRTAWVAGGLLTASLTLNTLDYNREWKDSLSLWLGCIEKHPELTVPYGLAAHAAIKAGDAQLALSILQRCLEVDPLDGACNGTLGVLLLRSRPEQGQALLRRALPRDETGDAHVALARFLADRGDVAQALQLYEQWLRAHPGDRQRAAELLQLKARIGR